jgi:hypothetical protein
MYFHDKIIKITLDSLGADFVFSLFSTVYEPGPGISSFLSANRLLLFAKLEPPFLT